MRYLSKELEEMFEKIEPWLKKDPTLKNAPEEIRRCQKEYKRRSLPERINYAESLCCESVDK